MKRVNRLTRSADFLAIRNHGQKFTHPLMILNTVKTDNKETRVAVIASKALGGAVARNRAKRRIRASVDKLLPMITPGWDLVIVARKNVVQAESEELQHALKDLLTRAGVL